MKRPSWKKTVITALALCLAGVTINGPGGAWAAGNPSVNVGELGTIGIILNGSGSGNAFAASPETTPNLIALLFVAAALLGVALLPNPYQGKGEKKPGMIAEKRANIRKTRRNRPRRSGPRLATLDEALPLISPISMR
jgi:hypothetical protein